MKSADPGLCFDQVGGFDDVDVVEMSEPQPAVASEPRYACVAMCHHDARLPAIGGTRAIYNTPANIRKLAVELARTMDEKVSLIRLAERELGRTGPSLFEWRGGKGIILLPSKESITASPRLLLAYGRLVEFLGGEFFASIDANVGRSQLRWIERATSYTVGNTAQRQSSEATAIGVHAAIHATLGALDLPAERLRQKLGNVHVTLFGLGKVGFSLLRMLYDDGATIRIWDPRLHQNGWKAHFAEALRNGAQIDTRDREILIKLERDDQLFGSEYEALVRAFAHDSQPIRIVCAAADGPRWLLDSVAGKPRYEHFAMATHDGPKIIIGATNDQLGAVRDKAALNALTTLSEAGVLFVPDPIVSPGGVISVSWELAPLWTAEDVRRDTEDIVRKNVELLFENAGGRKATALTIEGAFRGLLVRARML